MPRFKPQVPGPSNRFRFAVCGLLNRSAPIGGGANTLGSNNWSPFFLLGLPVTSGRNEVVLKSPTASMKLLAMLPGNTGPQLSHTQNGVKPVPDLMNPCQEVSQPPAKVSVSQFIFEPYFFPLPNGS